MQVQFTERMQAALTAARALASEQRSPELFTIHLLTVLTAQDDSTFSALLVANGVDLAAFHRFASNRSRQVLPEMSTAVRNPQPSGENSALMQGAAAEMQEIGDSRLGTEHVLLAALKYRPGKGAWSEFGLSYGPVRASLEKVRNDSTV